MYYTGWWGPNFHWFWIMPFFFMILMFVCFALMIRRAGAWRGAPGNRAGWIPFGCWGAGHGRMAGGPSETPRQVLDRRYASGEITREQYGQMKRDLESSS